MMTFLSRSIRQLFASAPSDADLARPSPEAAAGELALGSSLVEANATPGERAFPPLRVVRGGDSGSAIMPALPTAAAASAFVAGQGARLYSLDVFRRARAGGRPDPHFPAASPRSPRVA